MADRRQQHGYTDAVTASGFFVTLEGLDGCGKTTQLNMLVNLLRARRFDVVVAQEPGGTRIGRSIRSLLLDSQYNDLHPNAELLLYFASRVQNLAQVICPALDAGRVVVCDRFTDATVAYQGYGRNLGADCVEQIDNLLCWGMDPDLTVWLDIEPSVALARARKRNASRNADEGRMESQDIDFFERVRRGYAQIESQHPKRVRRVDATGSPAQVAQRVNRIVIRELERHVKPSI